MRVESINLYSNFPSSKNTGKVANIDEIKSILYLGIKSDIPHTESKRKVDIII